MCEGLAYIKWFSRLKGIVNKYIVWCFRVATNGDDADKHQVNYAVCSARCVQMDDLLTAHNVCFICALMGWLRWMIDFVCRKGLINFRLGGEQMRMRKIYIDGSLVWIYIFMKRLFAGPLNGFSFLSYWLWTRLWLHILFCFKLYIVIY